jgi:hypothetical protein
MTLLAAGITQTVIQEMMPPYSLDADLLAGAVTILPPPPPDASASWRQARLTRLVREISVLMPADAAQAKLAAQIVVYRETADDTLDRANVPGLTVEQVCRVRRAAADLTRTSTTLERALSRRQEQPAAFFGTVLADQVDIAALDAVWCKGARADRSGAASVGAASVGAASVPQPAAPDTAASEPAAPEAAASEPAAPERGTGIGPVGLVPAARAPAGFAPAGLRPESESAPRATPLPDPTVHPMAGLSGGSGAPIHDGRPEARAA